MELVGWNRDSCHLNTPDHDRFKAGREGRQIRGSTEAERTGAKSPGSMHWNDRRGDFVGEEQRHRRAMLFIRLKQRE